LLPYSCLEVVDVIDKPGQPALVQLREIPIPRGSKVVFWVDDNPENNYQIAATFEKMEISCVFCTSTKDALKVISNYRWLLYFDQGDFRIITDMVRNEDGKINYTAGIELLKELYQTYNYGFEVMIYCQDVKKAEDNCKKLDLKGRYKINAKEDELKKFLGELMVSQKSVSTKAALAEIVQMTIKIGQKYKIKIGKITIIEEN